MKSFVVGQSKRHYNFCINIRNKYYHITILKNKLVQILQLGEGMVVGVEYIASTAGASRRLFLIVVESGSGEVLCESRTSVLERDVPTLQRILTSFIMKISLQEI